MVGDYTAVGVDEDLSIDDMGGAVFFSGDGDGVDESGGAVDGCVYSLVGCRNLFVYSGLYGGDHTVVDCL